MFVDRDERARGDPFQLVDEPVGPSRIHGPLEIPVAPVIRDDQTVPLHRAEHHPGIPAEARDVERSAQAEPSPHGGASAVTRPGPVAGGPDVGVMRAAGRHPDRVVDEARVHLVVPEQPGEDREPRRIGARPSRRPEPIRIGSREVEDRAAPAFGFPPFQRAA
jgi:hypothetical protein